MIQVLEMLKLTNPKETIKFLLTIFEQKRMDRLLICLLLLWVMAASCKKEVDRAEIDRLKIEAYIAAGNLEAEIDPSGLYYQIQRPGTGLRPKVSDQVEVRYKGYLLDGTVFDQTNGEETIVFNLSGLIPGWLSAIPLLREGGEGIFILPSALGYGHRSQGPIIGPYEVLIFEIELVSVIR